MNWSEHRKDLLNIVDTPGTETSNPLKGYQIIADSANRQGVLVPKRRNLFLLPLRLGAMVVSIFTRRRP